MVLGRATQFLNPACFGCPGCPSRATKCSVCICETHSVVPCANHNIYAVFGHLGIHHTNVSKYFSNGISVIPDFDSVRAQNTHTETNMHDH